MRGQVTHNAYSPAKEPAPTVTSTLSLHAALPISTIDPRYPDSDGRPMGDTDFHSPALRRLCDALQDYFAGLNFYIAENQPPEFQPARPNVCRHLHVLMANVAGTHSRRAFQDVEAA